ncbi:MAG TPA: hypothetical protein H9698_00475 [Candidatus Ruthenibacterium merdavium]|uniref:Uncharacterized protein n=1 Tax=Candidatus Ruthenibacterium merdavium TaxID=2838752 RepID=A0A9D2Q4D5_9FIRM|nr:hypothetical protein [Candidatus Ruthenibacterium merdavium]
MIRCVAELLSEAYHRMTALKMTDTLALERKEFLFSFLYLKHSWTKTPI